MLIIYLLIITKSVEKNLVNNRKIEIFFIKYCINIVTKTNSKFM